MITPTDRNLLNDLSKVAVNRLGYSFGHELERFARTSVASHQAGCVRK